LQHSKLLTTIGIVFIVMGRSAVEIGDAAAFPSKIYLDKID